MSQTQSPGLRWVLAAVLANACASPSPAAPERVDAGGTKPPAMIDAGSANRVAGAAGKPSGSGSGGTVASAGSAAGGGNGGSSAQLVWKQASLTNFTSYPDPGSDECIKYNGCMWAGQFAAVDGKQTEAWVMAHNIVAVHSKDFNTYKLKQLRLRKDGHEIDVTVYDECADSDCSGCCTENAKPSGFLIDIERYTAERFGVGDGQVDWACLDCQ
jgi:hypothetical protein